MLGDADGRSRHDVQEKPTVQSYSARGGRLEQFLGSRGGRIIHWLRSSSAFARRLMVARGTTPRAYRKWIRRYDAITPQLRVLMAREITSWPSYPLVSLIMPIGEMNEKWLRQAIASVRNQIYPHWELCIFSGASTMDGRRALLEQYAAQESRIHVTLRNEGGHTNSNSALALARGDHVTFLNPDDCLSEDALFWFAREISLHPEADLLFSDEDKIDEKGKRSDPHLKSAWNSALMLSQDAFSHLGIFRRSIVEQVGCLGEWCNGLEEHDLVLRCSERTTADRIRHIPRVLYHRRAATHPEDASVDAKTHVWARGVRAIEEHLSRKGLAGKVNRLHGACYQVDYQAMRELPKISILMPSACNLEVLRPCVTALLERSTYSNFEVLVAINEIRFREPSQAGFIRELGLDKRVRVLVYHDQEFNLARIINWAASQAEGSLFCLMNDDVEVITRDWLERLGVRTMLNGVGAAGPMLYYPSDVIQQAGVVLGVGGVAAHAFKGRPRGYTGYFSRAALEQDYSCLTGACLLVRRSIFETVGGFDETLPIAFNDADFCIKIRRAGERIVWTPSVEMYHHESVTLGQHDSPQRRKQFLQSVEVMQYRWQDVLENDPCYNPNLSLKHDAMFSLAWPPRMPNMTDIVTAPERTSISRTSQLLPEQRQPS